MITRTFKPEIELALELLPFESLTDLGEFDDETQEAVVYFSAMEADERAQRDAFEASLADDRQAWLYARDDEDPTVRDVSEWALTDERGRRT
jgi:hypothetical protein